VRTTSSGTRRKASTQLDLLKSTKKVQVETDAGMSPGEFLQGTFGCSNEHEKGAGLPCNVVKCIVLVEAVADLRLRYVHLFH